MMPFEALNLLIKKAMMLNVKKCLIVKKRGDLILILAAMYLRRVGINGRSYAAACSVDEQRNDS